MSRTVIGPETRVQGPLKGKDELVIEGFVDGPVEGEAQVTLAAGSTVNGTVRGRDVTVAGKLVHDVFATGTARLLPTAEVYGNIEAPRIAIDAGALFEGQVRMTKRPLAPPKATPTSAPTPTAVRGPESAKREIPDLPLVGKTRIQRRTS